MIDINTIIQDMQVIDDLHDRYHYIMELGNKLPTFPKEKMVDSNMIEGCENKLWMSLLVDNKDKDNPKLILELFSDSQMVRGLLYIINKIYSNKSVDEIQTIDFTHVFKCLQLNEYLSQKRTNGLYILVDRIQKAAKDSIK